MKKDYPVSAEQYLIEKYEKTKRENLQLKIENKTLLNKLKFYELSPKISNDDTDALENKLKALPILEVSYSVDMEYNYVYGSQLKESQYEDLKTYLKEITDNPKLALKYNKIGAIRQNDLNIMVTLWGHKFYGKAYIGYKMEMPTINWYEEIKTFDDEFEKYVKKIKDSIATYEKKQAKEKEQAEANENV